MAAPRSERACGGVDLGEKNAAHGPYREEKQGARARM